MSIPMNQGAQTSGQIRMACPSEHKSSVFVMGCCKCTTRRELGFSSHWCRGTTLCGALPMEEKNFVYFCRSGECINGNGTNISDGSDIEDWIVDVARVKVEESYKEYHVFSESSDDNDSNIVRTTSNIGK